ncbi:MAG: hypothetical protein RIQ60_3858 [Pseudomonadota bacterium]|jgi:hypothetical protein
MHLLIPHASALGEAVIPALKLLDLPRLAELLALLQPQPDDLAAPAADNSEDDDAEYRYSPPHEAALARLAGWPGRDGNWPLAAWWAAQDGLDTSDLAGSSGVASADLGLALLTPVHWHVGTEQISLLDPQQLDLTEAESRGLLQAVRPSFEAVGWRIIWGAPLRWYAAHPDLLDLDCASLDRVIGRNIDLWLPRSAETRLQRRLQVEVQMLLHGHAINDAREAHRLPAVNSFWLWGCGAAQAAAVPDDLQIDTRLSAPLLGGDWAAWCNAWQALDAGPVAELLARARLGQAVRLTLCGERRAHSWAGPSPGTRPVWTRFLGHFKRARVIAVQPVLEQL